MPKPVKKKKQFISKKNATTYRLIAGYTNDDDVIETPEEVDARKEEQREYGIFYDDGYNYMKHLRSMNEEATMVNINTSSNHSETQSSYGGSVRFKEFFSTDETKEERIDEEVLAALEDAPDVKMKGADMDRSEIVEGDESFLPDDFINQAGGAVPKEEIEDMDSDSDRYLSSDEADEGSFDWEDDDDDDFEDASDGKTPLRGRGNAQDDIIEAQTALILRNFEEGFGFSCAAQDDEAEMQRPEDYEGLKRILTQDDMKDKTVTWSDVLDDHDSRPKIDTTRFEYEDENEDDYEWKDMPPSQPKYDCVSILSLNSNTRNLPKDIIPPRQENKSRKPSTTESEQQQAQGLNRKQLEEEIRESRKADCASTFKPKDETIDEKKSRKKAIKDERKERRMEKKANKIVFSVEKHKMHKERAALSKSGGKGLTIS